MVVADCLNRNNTVFSVYQLMVVFCRSCAGSNPTLRTIPQPSVLLIRVRVKIASTLEEFTELLEKGSENIIDYEYKKTLRKRK